MTARHFLTVVAVVQGILLGALIILIVLNRWFRLRRSTRLNPRREAIDASMRRWAAGTTPLAGVLVGLSRLPVPLAIDAIVKWSARVPGERWRQLAQALEHHWWARLVRTNSTSARWWKRLESARFLSVAATPQDVARLTALAAHAGPEVRIQSARGLGSFPHRESVAALKNLVTDDAWAVRAQAVRSLGMIADVSTLPLVKAALQDNVWWVRLRAALALMRFAAPGRKALLEVEVGSDASARATAQMVLGLPAQALAEFAT